MNNSGTGEYFPMKKCVLNLAWCTDIPDISGRQHVFGMQGNFLKKNFVFLLIFSGLSGNGKDFCGGCWGSAGVC